MPTSSPGVLRLFRFHCEVAVDGGAAYPDDLADVGWLQALGFQVAGPLDVGVVGGDLGLEDQCSEKSR